MGFGTGFGGPGGGSGGPGGSFVIVVKVMAKPLLRLLRRNHPVVGCFPSSVWDSRLPGNLRENSRKLLGHVHESSEK